MNSDQDNATYGAHGDKSGRILNHAAAIKLDVQYPQFLDKNVKQYLIICSPGVKHD
jgi:hypothetical protein